MEVVAMTFPLLSEASRELLVAESLMRLKALRPVKVLLSVRRVEDAAVPVNGVRQVPFWAKQPLVMFTPFAIVVEPVFETLKRVVVAPEVEEAIVKALLKNDVSPAFKEIANLPNGVEVPMPSVPEVGSWKALVVAGRFPKIRLPMLSCWLPVSDWKYVLAPMPMFALP